MKRQTYETLKKRLLTCNLRILYIETLRDGTIPQTDGFKSELTFEFQKSLEKNSDVERDPNTLLKGLRRHIQQQQLQDQEFIK